MNALAFTKEVLELYLSEDLKEIDNLLRKDERILFQDLRFLFRSYRYAVKPETDWSPSPSAPGRCAPEETLNNNGGN